MKKIVIAPDSYKGCLSALEAARAIEKGLRRIMPEAEYLLLPLADGGEGTLDALLRTPGARAVQIKTFDAFMRPAEARIAELPDRCFAVELAEICGLERHKSELAPLAATTFGAGCAIGQAIGLGARKIIAAIGGSCSTDGGAGLAQALGVRFFNKAGRPLPDGLGGGALAGIAGIDRSGMLPCCELVIASDVTSPLYGPDGAAFVFSPQKGASASEVRQLDANLRHYAGLAGSSGNFPGDGAAGGAGFSLRIFANGRTVSGGNLIMEQAGLDKALEGADWLITGEGCSDRQTKFGKLCGLAAERARRSGARTLLLSGAIRDADELRGSFDQLVAVSPEQMPLEEAIRRAEELIERAAGQLILA